MRNCVIETSSGNVLRVGCCDFENDGSFDAGTETQLSDVQSGLKCYEGRLDNDGYWHRWNGSSFDLVNS